MNTNKKICQYRMIFIYFLKIYLLIYVSSCVYMQVLVCTKGGRQNPLSWCYRIIKLPGVDSGNQPLVP